MTKVYISGQITGLPYEQAEANFAKAADYLNKQGYKVVNPMVEVPYNQSYNWFDYMAEDIRLLGTCQAIYMLSCWINSDGANIEHSIADRKGLIMMYQNK